jgi:hypothetical protein
VLFRRTSYFEVRAPPDDIRLNPLYVSLRWVNQWESIWQLGAHFRLKLRWKATIDLKAAHHSTDCTWAHNFTAPECPLRICAHIRSGQGTKTLLNISQQTVRVCLRVNETLNFNTGYFFCDESVLLCNKEGGDSWNKTFNL